MSNPPSIPFAKEPLEKLRAWQKTQTRRRIKEAVPEGVEALAYQDGKLVGDGIEIPAPYHVGAKLLIEGTTEVVFVESVRAERLLAITEEDAQAEGYPSSAAFLAGEWAAGQQAKHGNPLVCVLGLTYGRPGSYTFRCGGGDLIAIGGMEPDRWVLGTAKEGGVLHVVADITERDAYDLIRVMTQMQLDAMTGHLVRTGSTPEDARMMTRFQVNLHDLEGGRRRYAAWDASWKPQPEQPDADA